MPYVFDSNSIISLSIESNDCVALFNSLELDIVAKTDDPNQWEEAPQALFCVIESFSRANNLVRWLVRARRWAWSQPRITMQATRSSSAYSI